MNKFLITPTQFEKRTIKIYLTKTMLNHTFLFFNALKINFMGNANSEYVANEAPFNIYFNIFYLY